MERHTAIQTFQSLLLYIVSALQQMMQWQLLDSRKSARTFFHTISQSDFIVSMVALEEVSSLMLPATKSVTDFWFGCSVSNAYNWRSYKSFNWNSL